MWCVDIFIHHSVYSFNECILFSIFFDCLHGFPTKQPLTILKPNNCFFVYSSSRKLTNAFSKNGTTTPLYQKWDEEVNRPFTWTIRQLCFRILLRCMLKTCKLCSCVCLQTQRITFNRWIWCVSALRKYLSISFKSIF